MRLRRKWKRSRRSSVKKRKRLRRSSVKSGKRYSAKKNRIGAQLNHRAQKTLYLLIGCRREMGNRFDSRFLVQRLIWNWKWLPGRLNLAISFWDSYETRGMTPCRHGRETKRPKKRGTMGSRDLFRARFDQINQHGSTNWCGSPGRSTGISSITRSCNPRADS